MWMRQFNKLADCRFVIEPIHDFWKPSNFEPLLVAIVFPFLPFRPFQLCRTPKMFQMGRRLCQVFQENTLAKQNILFEFFVEFRQLSSMPQNMVWRLLYFGQQPPFSCGNHRKRGAGFEDTKDNQGRKKRKTISSRSMEVKESK